jgi:hypothetical protein
MPRFFLTIYAALLLAFVTGTGIAQDKLDDYQPLGRSETTAYMADIKDAVTAPGGKITFSALAARIAEIDEANKRVYLDQDNILFLDIVANCFTYKYTIVREHGVLEGKPVNVESKDAAERVAEKETSIYKIIETVCTLKNGPRI